MYKAAIYLVEKEIDGRQVLERLVFALDGLPVLKKDSAVKEDEVSGREVYFLIPINQADLSKLC